LQGREGNLFVNKEAAQNSKTSMQILRNVWIETYDAGPLYKDKVDWDNAPHCDRFTALYFSRIATFGPEYVFGCRCSECGKKYEWAQDLSTVDVKALPPKSIETFLRDNRFHTTVQDPSGAWRKVVFQLLTPKIEKNIVTAQNLAPREKATVSIAQRLVSIEGLEDGKGPIKQYLEELDAGALFDLIETFDTVDGGIETTVTIECPHCGQEDDVELPLGASFWKKPKSKSSKAPFPE